MSVDALEDLDVTKLAELLGCAPGLGRAPETRADLVKRLSLSRCALACGDPSCPNKIGAGECHDWHRWEIDVRIDLLALERIGCVVVPVKATPEMLAAMQRALPEVARQGQPIGDGSLGRAIWDAAIDNGPYARAESTPG